MTNWPERLALCVEDADLTWSDAAEIFGVHRTTVMRAARRLQAQGIRPTQRDYEQFARMVEAWRADLDADLDSDGEMLEQMALELDRARRQKQRALDQRRVLNRLDRERYRTQSAVDSFLAAARDLVPDIQYTPFRPARRRGVLPREDVVVTWFDWHAFEKVNRSHVLGLNEVSGDVLCDRVQSIAERTISRMEELAATRDVRRVTILWGGDFVDGMIHELDRYAEADPVSVTLNTGAVLALATADVINAAQRLGVEVYVVGVPGNHGRLRADTPMQNTNAPRESLDYVAMAFARQILEGSPAQQIHLPDALYALFESNGQVGLLVHGDLLAKGSCPADRLHKTMVNLSRALGTQIDFGVCGHYHHIEQLGMDAFVCPSLKGSDGYAVYLLQARSDVGQGLIRVGGSERIFEVILAAPGEHPTPRYRQRWTSTLAAPEPASGPYIVGRDAA